MKKTPPESQEKSALPDQKIKHRPPRTWTKISLNVPVELTDLVTGLLSSITQTGVECSGIKKTDTHSSSVTITGYLENQQHDLIKSGDAQSVIERIESILPREAITSFHLETIVEEDWGVSWKQDFHTARITKRLIIKPSWEDFSPLEDEIMLELDPGLAFGTGLHASTRMALALIESLYPLAESGPATVLDVGTGTGILAMACARYGAQAVLATDNDPDAVATATDNIINNNLAHLISVTGTDCSTMQESFDLVLANIIHDTLIELAPSLIDLMQKNGYLILAGILKGHQENNIIDVYQARGLNIIQCCHQEEWAALLLKKQE